MGTVVKDKKVSDMTAGELQELIRNTIHEFIDPDYGLELRPEVEEELRESIRQKERGEGIPLEDVKKQLGLE
jgi:ABC-type glutathione transport system ATPase component